MTCCYVELVLFTVAILSIHRSLAFFFFFCLDFADFATARDPLGCGLGGVRGEVEMPVIGRDSRFGCGADGR